MTLRSGISPSWCALFIEGHQDTITGLSMSPDGTILGSNSMDNTIRYWDIKPFAPQTAVLKLFEGAVHSQEKILLKPNWSPDMTKNRFVLLLIALFTFLTPYSPYSV